MFKVFKITPKGQNQATKSELIVVLVVLAVIDDNKTISIDNKMHL